MHSAMCHHILAGWYFTHCKMTEQSVRTFLIFTKWCNRQLFRADCTQALAHKHPNAASRKSRDSGEQMLRNRTTMIGLDVFMAKVTLAESRRGQELLEEKEGEGTSTARRGVHRAILQGLWGKLSSRRLA